MALRRVQVAQFALILEALDLGEAIALQINHLEACKLIEILNAHKTLVVQIQLVVQLGCLEAVVLLARDCACGCGAQSMRNARLNESTCGLITEATRNHSASSGAAGVCACMQRAN